MWYRLTGLKTKEFTPIFWVFIKMMAFWRSLLPFAVLCSCRSESQWTQTQESNGPTRRQTVRGRVCSHAFGSTCSWGCPLCIWQCDKSPLRVHRGHGLQMFRCHHQWCPNSYKRMPIIHGFHVVSSWCSQMLLTRCTKTKLQIRLDIHAAF